MNFLCNFVFTTSSFLFLIIKKRKRWFYTSKTRVPAFIITLLHEPIVNCESRENHFASVTKKRKEEREREKGKKCNDVVTPLTICNANDVAADFSFLCNTSSIRNYHTKSPLVNKFFIVPAPVFPGRISFFLFIKFFLINRCIKLQRNNVVYGWKEERKKEKNNSE